MTFIEANVRIIVMSHLVLFVFIFWQRTMGTLPAAAASAIAILEYIRNRFFVVLEQKMLPFPKAGRRNHGILRQNQLAKRFFQKVKAIFPQAKSFLLQENPVSL